MPLPPTKMLCSVVSAWPSLLCGLHRLAVDDDSARVRNTTLPFPHLDTQDLIDHLSHTLPAEPAEVHVAGLPRRKIVRQVTPGASSAQHIQDTVDDLSHVDGARAASWPSRWDQRGDELPLPVGQIAGIRRTSHGRFGYIRRSHAPSSPSPGRQPSAAPSNLYTVLDGFREVSPCRRGRRHQA